MSARARWGWLLAVLAVAALPRLVVFHADPVRARVVAPDTFSYLNSARGLRGVALPPGWDEAAQLPRDDQGARTPGYPLFLDLVFAAAGWSPTPPATLARLGPLDPWHRGFLASQENLRAVQATQHGLGVLATGLAFAVARRWTGRPALAAVAALAAVGLRPAWLALFEPLVLSETLAATLVLACLWLVARAEAAAPRGLVWGLLGSGLGSLAVLVRPALVALPVTLAIGLARPGRRRWAARLALLGVPFVLVVGAWVWRTHAVHQVWSLSTLSGMNALSHVTDVPGALGDPRLRALAREFHDVWPAGLWIAKALVTRHGMTLAAASEAMVGEAWRALRAAPGRFARSWAGAFLRAWLPAEAAFVRVCPPPGIPGAVWYGALGTQLGVAAVALLAWVVRVPASARIGLAVVVVSAATVAVASPLDSVRYAFPAQALVTLCAAAVLGRALLPARRPACA